MYTYEQRMTAVNLSYHNAAAVIRELGYPNRHDAQVFISLPTASVFHQHPIQQ